MLINISIKKIKYFTFFYLIKKKQTPPNHNKLHMSFDFIYLYSTYDPFIDTLVYFFIL